MKTGIRKLAPLPTALMFAAMNIQGCAPESGGAASDGDTTSIGDSTSEGDASMDGASGPDPTAGGGSCGNGVVENSEECDAGANNSNNGACTEACELAECGDGFVGPGEGCDDGDQNDNNGCTNDCRLTSCGDGDIQDGEECDDGNSTNNDGCLVTCVLPECGDAILHEGIEECDDGNSDDSDGCTTACTIPRSCNELLLAVPSAPDGVYQIDPDGGDGGTGFQVYCDMTTAGGGWTVVERSAFGPQAIGSALFNDLPMNTTSPSATPHRLGRAEMSSLQEISEDMRIDCRGEDYLLADADNLFNGEGGASDCSNWSMVLYKEASLKGNLLLDRTMCTWNIGTSEGCAGAWHIDEGAQANYCGIADYPWTGQAITSSSSDTFAVDPNTVDSVDPVHDCHQDGASRWVMVR